MDDWATERSRFSHDWMKNSFMPKVGALLNACNGCVEIEDIGASLQLVLMEWGENMPTALQLINSCEQEMSPRKLFQKEPLSCLEISYKEVLASIAHNVWLMRFNIRQLLEDVTSCVSSVESTILALTPLVNNKPWTSSEMLDCSRLLSKMYQECVCLTESIARLPKNIMV